MLKRIEQIQNIGCYKNIRASRMQFDKLTFIYGDNSFGKSTMCDIFRSLSTSNSECISNRMSIPNDNNDPQKVIFKFQLLGSTTEAPITFSRNSWNPLLSGIDIFVFDTDFIHRNVFTGLTIDRQNQKNITQFVLGEDSVDKANKIANNKSELRAINKQISSLENKEFSTIKKLDDFIELKINLTEEQLLQNLIKIEKKVNHKKTILNSIDDIIEKNEPINLDESLNFSNLVDEMNTCFNASYEQINEKALESLLEHIKINCNDNINLNINDWIKEGVQIKLTEFCPFCGQELVGNANDLISSYNEYFNEAFKKFENEIVSKLNSLQYENAKYLLSAHSGTTESNLKFIKEYLELINGAGFENEVKQIDEITQKLKKLFQEWNDDFESIEKSIDEKIKEKRYSIIKNIGEIDLAQKVETFNEILDGIKGYNKLIDIIMDSILTYKADLNYDNVSSELENLKLELDKSKTLLMRKQLDSVCKRYSELVAAREINKQKTVELESNLETEQNSYLNEYFDKINELFNKLGSSKFKISKTINRRGHMPVVSMTAKYCNVQITNELITTFLSESDRRALALSVFLAKVLCLSDEQREKTILVFDDPVTSFDDNRIDRTIRLFEGFRKNLRQMIILSHYPKYIKVFFERANLNSNDIKLLKLSKNNLTTSIEEAKPIDFVETLHQQKYRKIKSYIAREHFEDISSDLRIFLEEEVKMRFKEQINENELQNLQFSNLIEGLKDAGVISQNKFDNTELLRLTLNVDHHIWSEKTQDEIIGIAADVIDHIYTSWN